MRPDSFGLADGSPAGGVGVPGDVAEVESSGSGMPRNTVEAEA